MGAINFICPKCGKMQPIAETCPYCGVVVEKYLKRQHSEKPPTVVCRPAGPKEPRPKILLALVVRLSPKITIFLLCLGAFTWFSLFFVKNNLRQQAENKRIGKVEIAGNTKMTYLADQIVVERNEIQLNFEEIQTKLHALERRILDNQDAAWNLSENYRLKWYNSPEHQMDLVKTHHIDDETAAAAKNLVKEDEAISAAIRSLNKNGWPDGFKTYLKGLVTLSGVNHKMVNLLKNPEARIYNFPDERQNIQSEFNMTYYQLRNSVVR